MNNKISENMLEKTFTLILIFSFIFLIASSSPFCNEFALNIQIEAENSWGTHKKASVILKNTQKRHICSAKFKMTFPADSQVFNKWNMKKTDVPDEYTLPESWILEDFEERRDTGFVMTGSPPKVEPISLRFCDSTDDEIADCGPLGFTVKAQEKQAWGDKKEIRLIFNNTGEEDICYTRFKVILAKDSKILTSWNMKRLKLSGDYILPQWAKLIAGEEFRETGFLLSGPMPAVKRVKHRFC